MSYRPVHSLHYHDMATIVYMSQPSDFCIVVALQFEYTDDQIIHYHIAKHVNTIHNVDNESPYSNITIAVNEFVVKYGEYVNRILEIADRYKYVKLTTKLLGLIGMYNKFNYIHNDNIAIITDPGANIMLTISNINTFIMLWDRRVDPSKSIIADITEIAEMMTEHHGPQTV